MRSEDEAASGGTKGEESAAEGGAPVKKKRDPSRYNLVEAAQYGYLGRLVSGVSLRVKVCGEEK